MSKSQSESKNNIREHRDPSNPTSVSKGSNGSHAPKATGNNGIMNYSQIKNPADIELIELVAPKIARPSYKCHVDWYKVNGRNYKPGVYYHSFNEKNEFDRWICSPIEVLAISFSVDSDNFGRFLRFLDTNGRWQRMAMPMSLLGGNLDELCKELLSRGVLIERSMKGELANYLMHYKVDERIYSTSQIGWHKNTFVLPDEVFGNDKVVFQSEQLEHCDFKVQGSLEGWQLNIGKFCEGNIPLIVAVSSALSGPIMDLIDRPGFCIHLVGDSSCGKTTALEVAASVWGGPNFIRSWRSTSNGLESVASLRNNTCLMLDEIDEVPSKEVGNMVYMLVNG